MARDKTGALLGRASAAIGAVARRCARPRGRRGAAHVRRPARAGVPGSSTTCSASGATRRSPASRSAATCAAQEVAAGRRRARPRRRGRGRRAARRCSPRAGESTTDDLPSARPSSSSGRAAATGPPTRPAPASSLARARPSTAPTIARRRAEPSSIALGPLRRRAGDLMTARPAPRDRLVAACARPSSAAVDHLLGAAGRRRLVEGRARDQRDDGRRGPAAAPVPRHPRRRATTEAAARWIRSQQRDDGTWATFHGGPGDLSTTVEAYVALRLAGDPPDAAHMRAPRAVRPRPAAGSSAARVFTRIWLALFGLWSWDDLPGAAAGADLPAARGSRSTSTTSAAGRGRRSCRSPSSPRCRPVRPLPFGSTSCAPARAPGRRPPAAARAGRALPAPRPRCCTRYERRPSRPLRRAGAAPRRARGSSRARRPTAAGAASSRRGSTR